MSADKNYWQEEDYLLLEKALSYSELFNIAERILKRMPKPVCQVCGPISTGGAGSIEENLKRFERTIAKLNEDGMAVFNQVPFETPMQRIKVAREKSGYDHSLLNDFYLPIFESRLIHKMYFLPDWESSTGATWEHEQAKRLNLEIIYL